MDMVPTHSIRRHFPRGTELRPIPTALLTAGPRPSSMRVHSPKMKLALLLLAAAFLASTLGAVDVAAADAPKKGRGKLVHMVAFKFKDSASKDDIRKVEQAFAALPAKVPQIASFESGTNVSPEKLDKGFTHGFLLTFHSQTDRDEYLVHPDHKAFGALIGPYLADVFVIDFWAQKPAKAGKTPKKKN